MDEAIAYWSRVLAGAPPELVLPTEPLPTERRSVSEQVPPIELPLPMDAVAQLRARATELNLELKAVAAACLAYVAAYHAREDEVLLLLPGVDAGQSSSEADAATRAAAVLRLAVDRGAASVTSLASLATAAQEQLLSAARPEHALDAETLLEAGPEAWRGAARPLALGLSSGRGQPAMPPLAGARRLAPAA